MNEAALKLGMWREGVAFVYLNRKIIGAWDGRIYRSLPEIYSDQILHDKYHAEIGLEEPTSDRIPDGT